MVATNPYKRFTELESQADALVDTLEQLRRDTGGYESAAGRLDDAAKGIHSVLDTMISVSKRTRETVKDIGEIVADEIVASQEARISAFIELDSRIKALESKFDSRFEVFESKIDDVKMQNKRSLFVRFLTFS